MDCPNCHTYNPDERTICWRCDKPLPKPQPEKKKKQGSSQQWLYILIAVMVIMMLVNMCGLPRSMAPEAGGSAPTGMVAPHFQAGL
jgi:predicted nucleic acid-binding Zn ribbon protein